MRVPSLLSAVMVGVPLLVASGCLRDVNRDGRVLIACLGDSNTQAGWPDAESVRWCELAAARLPDVVALRGPFPLREPVQFLNLGLGGGAVTDAEAVPWAAPSQLRAALAAGADVVIAAFGTNDVRRRLESVEKIVSGYRTLCANAAPARCLVALTPPVFPPHEDRNPAIATLNAALRGAFPPSQVIDFWTGFERGDFSPDGLHLSHQGQEKRASRAVDALH